VARARRDPSATPLRVGSFPGKGSQNGTSGTRAGGPAPGPRTELTLIRRLYPRRAENRREPTGSIKCLTML
jgi:hypothetical protein